MLNRRQLLSGAIRGCVVLGATPWLAHAQTKGEIDAFEQIEYPPFEAIGQPEKFGTKVPTQLERDAARKIIQTTPNGPTPYAIAESFVARYYNSDRVKSISQWPRPEAWNPLIVEFFTATSRPANNDLVAWCAAFANWCLERSGRNGTNSAASQSFLNDKYFKKAAVPKTGDLVVFTCYDNKTGKTLGLGHVAFVKKAPVNGQVLVIGGNQAKDGHSSVISEVYYTLRDRQVVRRINGKRVPCTMKFNTFLSVV